MSYVSSVVAALVAEFGAREGRVAHTVRLAASIMARNVDADRDTLKAAKDDAYGEVLAGLPEHLHSEFKRTTFDQSFARVNFLLKSDDFDTVQSVRDASIEVLREALKAYGKKEKVEKATPVVEESSEEENTGSVEESKSPLEIIDHAANTLAAIVAKYGPDVNPGELQYIRDTVLAAFDKVASDALISA